MYSLGLSTLFGVFRINTNFEYGVLTGTVLKLKVRILAHYCETLFGGRGISIQIL